MREAENVSIEQMKVDLIEGGWKEKNSTTWISPAGMLFRGPFKAWSVLLLQRHCDRTATQTVHPEKSAFEEGRIAGLEQAARSNEESAVELRRRKKPYGSQLDIVAAVALEAAATKIRELKQPEPAVQLVRGK